MRRIGRRLEPDLRDDEELRMTAADRIWTPRWRERRQHERARAPGADSSFQGNCLTGPDGRVGPDPHGHGHDRVRVLARTLGPETFGLVATTFAYATLGGLLTDFGFGLKTLREIANQPEGGKGFHGSPHREDTPDDHKHRRRWRRLHAATLPDRR